MKSNKGQTKKDPKSDKKAPEKKAPEKKVPEKKVPEKKAPEKKTLEKKPIEKKPVDKTRGGIFTKDEAKNATVVIKENIDEIVGIDGKVYGPFLADDVVVLPNITAQIIIDSNKATLVNN